MNKQLGVGVEVFIGWTEWSRINESVHNDPRLRRGQIIGGPYPSGEPFITTTGCLFRNDTPMTAWEVQCGHEGLIVREPLLTPIDDDQESVTRLAELDASE